MSEIIPAILAENVEDLKNKLSQIPKEIKLVHIDVLEDDVWTDISINFEAHLMVKEPDKIFDQWISRGAKRIITHSLGSSTSKLAQVEVGFGVELQVPLVEIWPLISKINFVHLMSIAEIGEQNHPLDERIFDRIKQVREKFPQIPISVDGGIDKNNYEKLIDLGANRLIVGSHFQEVWENSLMKK